MSGIRKLKIPVLMYHAIAPKGSSARELSIGQNVYTVDEGDFSRQMGLLAANGFSSVTVDELSKEYDIHSSTLRSVILTFDDGYVSDYDIVLKRLSEWGFSGNYFVTVDFIGKPGYMTWEHIRELHNAGHNIGSHGITHRYLTDLDDEEVARELSRSKSIIEDKVGSEVKALSLPGGRGGRRVLRMARELGYSAVCTSTIGASTVEEGFLVLNRLPIRNRTSLDSFLATVQFRPRSIIPKRLSSRSRSIVSGIIGNRRYDVLRERLLSVGQPR